VVVVKSFFKAGLRFPLNEMIADGEVWDLSSSANS
jgi:hypothetical protein